MANVPARQVAHATLTANTVDTVTLSGGAQSAVEVLNRSTSAVSDDIYFTVDGTTVPTVGGAECFIVQPGQSFKITGLPIATNTVVKLKSASAVPYSVTGG